MVTARNGAELQVQCLEVQGVKYAEAFGATGLRIHSADEIGPVLRQALNTRGPVLVEIPIDYRHNQDLCAIVSEHATS